MPWSHLAGKRKTPTEPSSQVRVYERDDLDGIFMTRAWIRTPSGRPKEEKLPAGITQKAAEVLADMTASERQKAILGGRDEFGEAPPPARITLGELLDQYHESAVAMEWSEKHRADRLRSRKLWMVQLGPDHVVQELDRDLVKKKALQARGDRSMRWVQKQLAYLRAAVLWGFDVKHFYDKNPLRGLKLPEYKPETERLIYDLAEMRLLWTPHEEIDWRVTLFANIQADTGRRIEVVLGLRVDDVGAVSVGGQARVVVHLPRQKGGESGWIPVSAQTAELLAQAMDEPIVESSGWIFPEGRLEYDDARDKPLGVEAAIRKLHEAEAVLDIEHVPQRATHGIKRTHVTVGFEASGDEDLVKQQTGNLSADVLRRIYRKGRKLFPKRSVRYVDDVRAVIEEGLEEAPEET